MSRHFDELHDSTVELYGEIYKLIKPNNYDSLMEAVKLKEYIETYLAALMHDEKNEDAERKLEIQVFLIEEYLQQIGDFDNKTLVSNISFLMRKSGRRIRDLEGMLGISAGYISRTMNENSGKKMSIDILWKISKIFEVDIEDLLYKDLKVPTKNSELVIKFLKKLVKDTVEEKIIWSYDGGLIYGLDDKYIELNLVQEVYDNISDYSYKYFPSDKNIEIDWFLNKDIICCNNFMDGKDLVLISYEHNTIKDVDCFLISRKVNKWEAKKLFTADDHPMSNVLDHALALFEEIELKEFDNKIDRESKNVMSTYLNN